jgi:hypothetical protein
MSIKRRNRRIMGTAIILGAIFVGIDHSQYRRSVPTPVAGDSEPEVEAGGYGSASDDTDTSLTSGPGAETGGYGVAADDADTPIGPGPETGGYGVATGASPDDSGQGAAATTTPDEEVSEDMEEYYKRLQLDADTGDTR